MSLLCCVQRPDEEVLFNIIVLLCTEVRCGGAMLCPCCVVYKGPMRR